MLYYILASLILLSWAIYLYLVRNNDYFKIRGIPYSEPTIGFGNIQNVILLRQYLGSIQGKLYKKFKGYRYCGYFVLTEPGILLFDLELIKNVLIRDFSNFNDNGLNWKEDNEKYICKNPFVLVGEEWKFGRTLVATAFSSGRIKHMFESMAVSATRFMDYASTDPIIQQGVCINIKEFCSRYCVDSVTGCVLSLDIHEYTEDTSDFREMGKRIFGSVGLKDDIRFLLGFWMPRVAGFLKISFVDYEVGRFFSSLLSNIVKRREERNLELHDFLDYIRSIQKAKPEFNKLHIVANVLTFLTDGFEVSSQLMAYCLYEMAMYPETLAKAQDEIDRIFEKYKAPLSYEMVKEMKYLESALFETLRKHPSTPVYKKRCKEPYKIAPAKDGECPSFEIPSGMLVHVPISSIMMDPEIYPDPERFDPDRFSDEQKDSIPETAYFGFGVGPRKCIGQRFAITQTKVGLATILRNYNIKVNTKTQFPLKEDPHATFLFRPLGGIWLDLTKRNTDINY